MILTNLVFKSKKQMIFRLLFKYVFPLMIKSNKIV